METLYESLREGSARETLRRLLPPREGAVYVVERSRARSGMSRSCDVFVLEGRSLLNVTPAVAALARLRRNRRGEIVIQGAGFSLADHIAGLLCGAWGLYDDQERKQANADRVPLVLATLL